VSARLVKQAIWSDYSDMPWPFKSKPTRAAFTIGAYKLGDSVDAARLTEFSEGEYQVMGHQFKNERTFHAPKVTFLASPWNLLLGTVNGNIYKITSYLEFKTKEEANPVAMEALQYCTSQLGKPSSQKTGMLIWDTLDGNVILQTAETAEGLSLNLFISSKDVARFERL
jgi:hypothetical protein